MNHNEQQQPAPSHSSMSRTSDGSGDGAQTGLARNPVCGMDVVPRTAAGSIEHDGRTIYFCSRHCLEKFKADPAQYNCGGPTPITDPDVSSSLSPPSPPAQPAPAGTRYTCPMHPEIVRDQPGLLPDLRDGPRADDRRGRGGGRSRAGQHDPAVLDLPGPDDPAAAALDGGDDPRARLSPRCSAGGPWSGSSSPWRRRWSCGADGRSSSAAGSSVVSRQLNMFTLIAMGTGYGLRFQRRRRDRARPLPGFVPRPPRRGRRSTSSPPR